MQLTFLGTGTSQGVPMIGCTCPVCRSEDPRDQRMRCSVVIEEGDTTLLVDATPDLRSQAIRAQLMRIDAVLFTHAHADHILGFDDLRRFCDVNGGTLHIHASHETMQRLRHVFDYAFSPDNTVRGYIHPIAHEIEGAFQIGDIHITPLPVPHGKTTTLGFLFSSQNKPRFAYISDCAEVPQNIVEKIRGVPVVILDALRNDPHPTHMTFTQALDAAKKIEAGVTYFTHMTHEKKHADRQAELPHNVLLAHDGLKLSV